MHTVRFLPIYCKQKQQEIKGDLNKYCVFDRLIYVALTLEHCKSCVYIDLLIKTINMGKEQDE